MIARLVPSVLVVVLVIGACSSSDDASTTTTTAAGTTSDTQTATTTDTTTTDTASETTTTTSAPATTAAPAPPPTDVPATTTTAATSPVTDPPDDDFTDAEAADRETARTALISLETFPEGWDEDPIEDEDDDPGTEEFEAEFDACLGRDDGVRVGDVIDRLEVGTGDFHPADDDATTVSHEVVLAPDVETAMAAMAEVRIDGAETCLADVIGDFYRTAFADDPDLAEVGIGDVIVTRTESEQDPDIAVGVLLEVPLTIGDQTVSQFLELLYQREGRALSELSFSSFGAQFSRDGYTVLSDEVSLRLAAIGN